MNLLPLLFACLIIFAISFTLLYSANFSQDKRYKQLLLPAAALFISLMLLPFDDSLSTFYAKFLDEQFPRLLPYIQLLTNLTFLFAFLMVKWCWRLGGSLSLPALGKKYRWISCMIALLKKAASILYTEIKVNRKKKKI
jgi:hypothetical protein